MAERDGRLITNARDYDADEEPYELPLLPVFNSNTFSSSIPQAVMTEDSSQAPLPIPSKQGRKRLKSQGEVHPSDETHPNSNIEGKRKKRKSTKSKSGHVATPDNPEVQLPPTERTELPTDVLRDQLQELITASSSKPQTFKKREVTGIEKRRKKRRRSNDQEPVSQEASISGNALQTRKNNHHTPDAMYEVQVELNPQASPNAAHLLSPSHSRDIDAIAHRTLALIQKDSEAQIDTTIGFGDEDADAIIGTRNEGVVASGALLEQPSERRSAMTTNGGRHPVPDRLGEDVDFSPGWEAGPSSQKRTRSARKKAKPTFFEAPTPVLEDQDVTDGSANMSPSSRPPKARSRAKKESRGRKPVKQKLSQSMLGGSAEGSDANENTERARGEPKVYRQGRFSEAELERISRAVENFRKDHGMTKTDVNELIQQAGGATAGHLNAKLWDKIIATCPDRYRQKVINITRKKFHNFVARATWLPHQDAELAQLIEEHGTKWSKIGELIKRHPEDLRDRYRNYIVCGQNLRKDAWDEEEEQRLTQHVLESIKEIERLRIEYPTRKELKQDYHALINWQAMSERMDRTRSRLQCSTKWKAMRFEVDGKIELVSTQPDASISFGLEKTRGQIKVMPVEERYRLVLAIRATAVGTNPRIAWHRIVDKPYRNKWHRLTLMLLWRRYTMAIEKEAASVRDTAQLLVNYYEQHDDLPDVSDELFDDADEMDFFKKMKAEPAQTTSAGVERGEMDEELIPESNEDIANTNVNDESNGSVSVDQQLQDQLEGRGEEELTIDPALAEAAQPLQELTPAGNSYGEASEERSESDDGNRRAIQSLNELQLLTEGEEGREHQPSENSDSVMDDMEDLPARRVRENATRRRPTGGRRRK